MSDIFSTVEQTEVSIVNLSSLSLSNFQTVDENTVKDKNFRITCKACLKI